jgi:hypothetical protein
MSACTYCRVRPARVRPAGGASQRAPPLLAEALAAKEHRIRELRAGLSAALDDRAQLAATVAQLRAQLQTQPQPPHYLAGSAAGPGASPLSLQLQQLQQRDPGGLRGHAAWEEREEREEREARLRAEVVDARARALEAQRRLSTSQQQLAAVQVCAPPCVGWAIRPMAAHSRAGLLA